jgi:hypothetical protein
MNNYFDDFLSSITCEEFYCDDDKFSWEQDGVEVKKVEEQKFDDFLTQITCEEYYGG